jgi:flagellar protein FliO/FliZ
VRTLFILQRLYPGSLALSFLPAAQSAWAQQGPAAASSSLLSVLQVLFALLVVLGIIGLFAWLLRRVSQGQNFAGGLVKIRGGVMLGPKERVVLLEVADAWIIVGVGAGQVNALHTMPRPENLEPSTTVSHTPKAFGDWLNKALRGKSEPRT